VSDTAARLAELEARGLRRRLAPPVGRDLSSNDYLGLAHHPEVRRALIAALEQGVPHGGTGSRLLTGEHPAWRALEERFARWQGAEASLFHATGFAANSGLLPALVQPGDRVLSDALNHASLIDGIRLCRGARVEILPHLDLPAVASALAAPWSGTTWLVTESVFSMDGDQADLPTLAALVRQHHARWIVDEAHATGLYGPTGAGCIEESDVRDAVFASVHTAGKALGGAGAFVVGSRDLIDWLVQRSRPFVFSTAPAPFLAHGLDAALTLIQSDPERRRRPRQLADRLRVAIAGRLDPGASSSHILPVLVGSVDRALHLQQHLAGRGWEARAIRPPTVPEDTCRVRLVLHADLDEAEIDRLAADLLAWAAP
jgi:8-amino-7-oxononanoate synthase